jgi:hypothetical protein
MKSMRNKKGFSYIVSVESRKGGVGKTTAALCIAKLLHQRGFEVLFLDTDITGTNVTLALKSAFWEGITHIVKTLVPKKKENTQSNLLELFQREFMAGRGVPVFGYQRRSDKTVFRWQAGMINIIGSQIYGENEGKIICKPSILFDELHAFWFVKFLREICSIFREAVEENKRVAIIIDNSPGYVGIGPAIQEWLTDTGVDRNKFLFVSSLDEQDLRACLEGIGSLHSVYCEKWDVAKKLFKLHQEKQSRKEKNMTDWGGDEMKFAIRLLENKRDDKNEGNFDFYLGRGLKLYQNENVWLGDSFREKIEKYQGVIVNRVPWRFKKRWWAFRIENKKEKNEKINELLFGTGNWGEVSPDLMIEYNEYIESQFISESSVRREREWRRHPEGLEWIWKSARMAIDSYREKDLRERGGINDFFKRLNYYQVLIDDLLDKLVGVPEYTLRDLVKDQWQPKVIGLDLSRWLWRGFYREYPPFFKAGPRPENIEHRIHLMKELREIGYMEATKAFPLKRIERDEVVWEKILFSGSAALTLALQSWGDIPFDKMIYEFGKVIGGISVIELEHWARKRKSGRESIAMFLAQERLEKEEGKEKLFMEIRPFRGLLEDKRELSRFYEAFAKTQARILDLDNDVDLLISLIERAMREYKRDQGLLPYIEGIAQKVIVDKNISHEQGMEECRKGFRIAESLGQFEEVLRKVIARWEIE